jgi:uncharacterized protein YbjQ (UPF0145 family)
MPLYAALMRVTIFDMDPLRGSARYSIPTRRKVPPSPTAGGAAERAQQSEAHMQVTHTDELEGGRDHRSIGRIKAVARWRAANAPVTEADRQAAVHALIREAESYDADAIVGLRFEVDGVRSTDVDTTPLQRVAATGVAVKFAKAA